LALIIITNIFTINKKLISYACLIIFAFVISGIYDEPKPEKIEDIPDPDVLNDEEMDDFILEDGEFSYDNYDEVCCPECGEYLGKDVLICPNCKNANEDLPEVCQNCGKTREEIDFCPYCNHYY